MTDDATDHARRLLSDAADVLDSARPSLDEAVQVDELDTQRPEIRELAQEATDFLEETDPETLLDALGMGGADGPGSVPEAIFTGDPDRIAELRALLTLSRLAPGEDATADSPFDDEDREMVQTLGDLLTAQAGEDSTGEPEEPTDQEAPGDTTRETGEEITSVLQTALDDARSGLGDVIGEGDLTDDAGMLGDEESDEEPEDEGLLDVGATALPDAEEGRSSGPGDRESVSGYGRSTYSTVPGQDRPDMKGVRRYSTMADR